MFWQHIKNTLVVLYSLLSTKHSVFWVRDEGGIKIKILASVVLSDLSCWLSREMGSGSLGEQGKGRQDRT